MSPQVSKSGSHDHPDEGPASSQPRQKRRRGKARPETHAREATVKSLDQLGLHQAPAHGSKSMKRNKHKLKRLQLKRRHDEDEGAASSGDEYSGNLLETYIGQVGACVALGMQAGDVINEAAWDKFSEEERDSLRAHLPSSLSSADKDTLARNLVSGFNIYFGNPRDRMFDAVAAGYTHPRVRRWRLRVSLIERRHHIMSLREYHNRCTRRLLARKALQHADAEADAAGEALVGLAAGAPSSSKADAPLHVPPEQLQAMAAAAAANSSNDWDEQRWRRVLDFRNQETKRYRVPEHAFRYTNPWGHSIVGPLKRGPALDGGRPRGHVLLRNERPSHVTILCIVRDAASRLPGGRGTRSDICDLLRDSQYVREDASYQQLNLVVSGALDRLHYEENAPVKYDSESRQWVYLHNNMSEEDFERPEWAKCMTQKQLATAVMNSAAAGTREKKHKNKKQKRSEE